MIRKPKLTESKIMAALKQIEGGVPVNDLCRQMGVSSARALNCVWPAFAMSFSTAVIATRENAKTSEGSMLRSNSGVRISVNPASIQDDTQEMLQTTPKLDGNQHLQYWLLNRMRVTLARC